ncbi:DUF1669 domain-containing protein [Candidatus Woesearchaeota archaeon]|jgi:phosphatidylserine/phosphatidylglycerophosphate/cardiolipin synthase-like enzyme|nr:DUF1669 domain-containing protein [Candidatus Woesearchaeota archaeon]MBT4247818.1 DUF1669 domain-containing protein [Candidatus Woesearchaeota archaeon]MBT4434242.1 DUF1669 domain-containing protein [Candidatus Woesearchaeota archaeon]MBT7331837.1 DUF1669 domain-containing protein [Candidatus Woesearchaeota archaeon]
MKKVIYTILIILISLGSYYFGDVDSLTSATIADTYVEDQGDIKIYFCPHQECETALVNFIDSAEEELHCALFDIGLESIQDKLLEKSKQIDVKIVTDDGYLKKFNYSFVRKDRSGLMHNKFCIVDGKKISTGSMNPTNNGAHKNNNNLLLIESSTLADNYEAEFQEMWDGTYKKGENVLNPNVKVGDVMFENYFCPEDHCANHIKEELQKAETSIHFMTFSFTHEGIANAMLLKHLDNVSVEGVMEARQVSKYSQFMRLDTAGIDVVKDSNKNNMHHKVFIIDGKTVVTGSFNPSKNGDSRNDENILIIRDETIASRYLAEYERLR